MLNLTNILKTPVSIVTADQGFHSLQGKGHLFSIKMYLFIRLIFDQIFLQLRFFYDGWDKLN